MINKTGGRLYSPADEQALMSELWDPQLGEDLYRFVMFVFPWGQEDTPLVKEKGPRNWQRDILEEITDHIKSNKERMRKGLAPEMFRLSRRSGRGIGKSCLVSWLIHWFMTFVVGGTAIATANTESQLKTKTWGEMGKWLKLALNAHWFDPAVLSFRPHKWYKEALERDLKLDSTLYSAQAQLWSKDNPDAFAGAHNMIGMLLIFDESSGIIQPIWDISEGFFTEPTLHRYWFSFGNGRRNTGPFYNVHTYNTKLWRAKGIDARDVEGTDKDIYKSIIDQFGENSDVAKVEVYGEFPDLGVNQLIGRTLAREAMERPLPELPDKGAPLIMGVDPARGGDKTVIRFRRGRDARTIAPVVMDVRDDMAIVNKILDLVAFHKPDAVAIDAGHGTGIIDRLKELGVKAHEIWFGSKSRSKLWENKRTEMWVAMKDWLKGGCVDKSNLLRDDLIGPEMQRRGDSDKQRLEPKEDMKKRGLSSPDHGDALALTFAVKVSRKDLPTSRSAGPGGRGKRVSGITEDIFGGVDCDIF